MHVIRSGHRPEAILFGVLGDAIRPVHRALRAQPAEDLVRRPLLELLTIGYAHLVKRRLILTGSAHDPPSRSHVAPSLCHPTSAPGTPSAAGGRPRAAA